MILLCYRYFILHAFSLCLNVIVTNKLCPHDNPEIKKAEYSIDRNFLSDERSIVLERLYVNKESVERYGVGLSGQKSTYCGRC